MEGAVNKPEQKFGVSVKRIRQMKAATLRRWRHPDPVLERLREQNKLLNESNQRLRKILDDLEEHGVTEERSAKRRQDLLERERNLFEALVSRFPNNRVWNAIKRASFKYPEIVQLSTLREMVESGEIQKCRGIGLRAENFLKKVFQTVAKQEAPPL